MTLAQAVVESLLSRKMMLATAESCTGGMVAAAITDIAGSSAVFDRGFVTYSNQAKMEMLGVSSVLLEHYGAVSAEVALAMAQGALAHSGADIAVSITGIAGPAGGSAEKPVGLVHFAIAQNGNPPLSEFIKFGAITRAEIRQKSTDHALQLIARQLDLAP